MLACFYDLGTPAIDVAAKVDPVPPGHDYLDSEVSQQVTTTPPSTPAHVRVAYRRQGSVAASDAGFKTTA
ncbi:MAG TPA: hypothetical protein VFH73_09215 [Polyangia bacterium]|jgi:hypothetical protein|nr:hypothetical protein [Polyangia bacterium]